MSRRARRLSRILVVALVLSAAGEASPVFSAEPQSSEQLELTARTHFAASEYQQALEIYARLYAVTLHPTYLRNIGRCYQNLGQPNKAISSFREYLRKARNLGERERSEVQQYIREMEAMQAGPANTVKAEPKPAPPPAAPAPKLTAPAPTRHDDDRVAASVVSTPRPADEASPFYTRWWFWTLIAVAAGGAATAVVLSRGDSRPHADTTLGTMDAR